jgi:hypothetical protein
MVVSRTDPAIPSAAIETAFAFFSGKLRLIRNRKKDRTATREHGGQTKAGLLPVSLQLPWGARAEF